MARNDARREKSAARNDSRKGAARNDDVQALEDVAGADAYEYMFAKPYLDEVLEERKGRKQESSETSEKGVANAAKTIYDIYQKSDADNPLKTGNLLVDFAIGRNKYAKAWNIGYNFGKAAFVAEQAYKELYKGRKEI